MGVYGSPENLEYIPDRRKCPRCGCDTVNSNFCHNCGAKVKASFSQGKVRTIHNAIYIVATIILSFAIFHSSKEAISILALSTSVGASDIILAPIWLVWWILTFITKRNKTIPARFLLYTILTFIAASVIGVCFLLITK